MIERNLRVPSTNDLYIFSKELEDMALIVEDTFMRYNNDLKMEDEEIIKVFHKKEALIEEMLAKTNEKLEELRAESEGDELRPLTLEEERRNRLYQNAKIYYEQKFDKYNAELVNYYTRVDELQLEDKATTMAMKLRDFSKKVKKLADWSESVQWGVE